MAVDFSPVSERAWKTAQHLADNLGAELLLLHVLVWEDIFRSLEPAERAAGARVRHAEAELNIGPPSPEGEATMTPQQWADDVLSRWAAGACGDGTRVRTLVRAGVPHREIVAAAREERVHLIIMGTRGRGALERFLVGSVAERVIRTTSCPVLLCGERGVKAA